MFNSAGSNSLPLRAVEDVSGEYKKELQAIAELRGWKPASGTPPTPESRALDAEIDRVAELRSAVYRAFKAGDNDKVISYGRQMLAVISVLEKATGFASAAPVGGGLFGGKRKTEQIAIKFSWTEALRSGVKSSGYSIDLEKASILWNIGAAYSASGQATLTKGASGDLDDSTLKSATQDFLRAAGVFAYMEANVVSFSFPYEVSAELNASVFPWLKEFMVAKAAVLVYETAKTKKMTPASLSKLAMAAAEKFDKVVAMCEGAYLKAFLSKNASQHVDYCKSRVYYYSAVASQCAAQGHAAEEQYGLEIARLKQCIEFISLGQKTALAKNKLVAEEYDKIAKLAKERLGVITKENESFYLMPIPSPAELGAIESRLLAKIVDFAVPTEEESELSILVKSSELGKAVAVAPEVKDFGAPEPEFAPSGDDVNVEDLARLISMGFPEEQSKQALTKSKGNLAAAVEILQVAPVVAPVDKEKAVPSDLERLQSMGFSSADGAEALAKGGSLAAAIDYLQKKDALPKPSVAVDLKSDIQAPGKVPAKPEASGGIFSKLWGGGSGAKKEPKKGAEGDAKDADPSVVQQLVEMGYDKEDAAAAAVASGNKVSVAVHLLSQNPEKSPKKPEAVLKPEPGFPVADSGAPVDKGLLSQIQAMGFKESQARTALQKSKGNLDQALELLMSGDVKEDEPAPFVSPVPAIAVVPAYEPPFEFAAPKPAVDAAPSFKPYVPAEKDDSPLGILLAMGYEKERANAALLLSKNDVASAIEFLGKADSPGKPKSDEVKKLDPPKSGDKAKDKDKDKDKDKGKSKSGGGVFGLFGRRKSVEPNEELLKNLMMMGYSEEWSREALEKSKNDFGQALDLLSKRTEEEDKKKQEDDKKRKAEAEKFAMEERTRLAFEALRREEEEKKKREDERTKLAFEALRREEEDKRRREEERRAQEASAASSASSAESRAKDMFKIGQLMAMGFKREEVVAALMKANGNADAAIELLMASRK